jgi:hypothetical protein
VSKYHSKKIKVGDLVFDSKKEYNRYKELKILESKGIIKDLQRQVKFVLIPAQYEEIKGPRGGIKKKTLERECSYYADFTYIKDDEFIVEDTKGLKLPDYIIKRKLMLYIHNIRIKEV